MEARTQPAAGGGASAQVDGRAAALAVIVAGGNGSRMHPLTTALPKVLMPLHAGTVLDHIFRQLHHAGIHDMHLLLGHHADLVRAYASARLSRGQRLSIHEETGGRGTAGPLRVLPEDGGDWIVINGDVVADVDVRTILDEHRVTGADLTVLGVPYRMTVPFGVLRHDGAGNLVAVEEKPTVEHLVNGGIYVLGPQARQLIPAGRSDMTDLVTRCADAGLRIRVFQLTRPWFDIGTLASYETMLRSDPTYRETRKTRGDETRAAERTRECR